MNVLISILTIISWLSIVLSASNRELYFNYQNNAACVLINQPTPLSKFVFDFNLNSTEDVPLLIFNYLDIVNFKNLPNFDQFMNHTYLDENKFLTTNGDVLFNLITFGDKPLPESIQSTIIKNSGNHEYQILQNGTYCIYLPLYSFDEEIVHPTNYHATMKIEHEFRHIDIYHKFASNLTIAISLASTLLFLSYFNPQIKSLEIEKLSDVKRDLSALLFGLLAFYLLYAFFELTIIFAIPSDSLYNLVENHYGHIQFWLFDKWQKYIISKVYFGSGYINSPIRKPKIFNLVFFVNFLSSLMTEILNKNTQDLVDVFINDQKFEILYQSVLVPRFYKFVVQSNDSDLRKTVLSALSTVQLASGSLMQLILFMYGFKLIWNLKNDQKLLTPILQSVLVHLIAWTTFSKHVIYHLYMKLSIGGIFDVGELLNVIGSLIESYQVKLFFLNIIEILIIWFIWSRNHVFKTDVKS